MIPIKINNRPFASDYITGLMLPDGIFEASMGRMQMNAHFTNTGPAAQANLSIYAESASHPAILITPVTHTVSSLAAGAATLKQWEVDISSVPAGTYYVSFIAENAAGRQRIIKKIFVTKVNFNSANHTFSAETPEGTFTVRYREITEVTGSKCCGSKKSKKTDLKHSDFLENLSYTFSLGNKKIELCPVFFLPLENETGWIPNPPYEGQYSDLPFQDPWWKILFAIIAVILLIASAIAEATSGTGSVGGTVGCPESPIGVCATGGGTSYVAAGLLAAAAAVATVAVLSDERDLLRIGQDKTPPNIGEFTVKENMLGRMKYIDAIEFGKPFKVGIDWKYERLTKDINNVDHSYSYSESTVNTNVHLLSRYDVNAPDVIKVYKKEPFIVTASFYDGDEKLFKGEQLFVKCFLVHVDSGRGIDFMLEDNGSNPDRKKNDGKYTGIHYFNSHDAGRWHFYVVAQDINHANEEMSPEDAAKIIGGMVLTNQTSITFTGGTCSLVPDGDVHVIA